jgi:hypothetical protein
MKKVNTKLALEKWVTYDKDKDIKIKIRPYPKTQAMYGVGDKDLAQLAWDRFNYCLVDWKGLLDDDDAEWPCSEDNKKYIFDYDNGELFQWISNCISELKADPFHQTK